MNTACEKCKCEVGNKDRLMNQGEVAAILSISTRTLEFYRSKGCGGPKYIKLGKLARYRESDVQAYISKLAGK